jgi:hypothetical protein
MDEFGDILSVQLPTAVFISGSIAFLVTYAFLVEVEAFTRNRTLLAGATVAVTVAMIAAVLAGPVIGQWALRVDRQPGTISTRDLRQIGPSRLP